MRQARNYAFLTFVNLFIFVSLLSVLPVQAVETLTTKDLLYTEKSKPIVAAHRAGPTLMVPENSMAALKRAVESGFHMIEIDVTVTKDGTMILFHDRTLKRLTQAPGRVDQYSYDDLKDLKLYDYDNSVTEETIITLDQAFDYLKDKNILIELDLKKKSAFDDMVAAVEKYKLQNKVLFIAYTQDTALEWQKKNDWIFLSTPYGSAQDINDLKLKGLDSSRTIAWIGTRIADRQLITALNASGLQAAFGTLGWRDTSWDKKIKKAGDKCLYKDFINQGVNIIVTDFPATVLSVINNPSLCP